MVVHQHHRRVAARTHALTFFQGELAVGRGLAEVDAELLPQVFGGAVGTAVRAELARQVRAERDLVFADRRGLVHRVESSHFLHGDCRHAEIVRDELHEFRRQPAMLFLSSGQRRHHGGLFLIGGILRDRTIDFFQAFS
jgi:hypothetical protein